jgi:gas vesicle protein
MNNNNDKEGAGFMSGVVLGMMIGAALAYIYSSPDGKKKAKKLIDESTEIMKNMGEKAGAVAVQVGELKQSFEEQIREAASENGKEPSSFASSLRKRFFQKGGRKLN